MPGTGSDAQQPDGEGSVPGTGGTGGTGSVEPDAAVAKDGSASIDAPPASTGPFALSSTEFKDGDAIAPMYRCPPNANISPPLSWTPGPAGTKSYAVTLAHAASIHWQLWDIPEGTTSLPMDIAKAATPPTPPGSKQSTPGLENLNNFGYIGPCPKSAAVSQYPFTVYALKVDALGLPPQTSPADVAKAIKANAIANAVLTVTGHN
jgi:Raf kinase inhibitor-like YbhB/YbcL family protein